MSSCIIGPVLRMETLSSIPLKTEPLPLPTCAVWWEPVAPVSGNQVVERFKGHKNTRNQHQDTNCGIPRGLGCWVLLDQTAEPSLAALGWNRGCVASLKQQICSPSPRGTRYINENLSEISGAGVVNHNDVFFLGLASQNGVFPLV